jgi:uncharacterized damage-inducible protein DinB
MDLRDALLAELDQEMAATRVVLERVPAAHLAWKPHEKSFSLGGLAAHLAELPHWGCRILDRESYDLADTAPRQVNDLSVDLAEILRRFEQSSSDVRRSLVDKTDGELRATWTLARAGVPIMKMPRLTALERFLVHHTIHHRGQMTVYLRLHDVPLPPIYGPTADERM